MARERREFTRISGIKDPSLIVIATEGEKTEQRYFESIKQRCEASSSRIHIKVLDPVEEGVRAEGNSSPKHVLGQLDSYKNKYGLNSDDELCMVIDRDKQSWNEAQIAHVASECARKQFLLALSNPCFEIWLLLHLENLAGYEEADQINILEGGGQYLKQKIRGILGEFNPSNFDPEVFWDETENAIQRANELDVEPLNRWPNGIGTRVYLLVQKIVASLN